MKSHGMEILSNYLWKLAKKEPASDAELLRRYLEQHDEIAFELLVQRYGSLVRRVCRSALPDDNDADDVFQATFVLLSHKASSIRQKNSIGPWLHSVAVRLAWQLRRKSNRRRKHESRAAGPGVDAVVPESASRELRVVIDEELTHLPDKLRVPLILCYLEGKTRDEVAGQLGVPQRSLTRRLEKGRELLRSRLKRRGVEMGLALMVTALSGSTDAAVPRLLVTETVHLAGQGLHGLTANGAAAVELAKGSLTTLFPGSSINIRLAILVVFAGLGTATAALSWGSLQTRLADRLQAESAPSVLAGHAGRAKSTKEKVDVAADGKSLATTISGRILDADGKPLAHASVTALARRPFGPGEHGLRDEVLVRGQADESGRFHLDVKPDFPTWLPERSVQLVAAAPGKALTALQVPVRGAAAEADLRLAAEGSISGQVVDPDGRPVENVRVQVVRAAGIAREPVQGDDLGQPLTGWPPPVASDAQGRYLIGGLNPDDGVWLQFQHDAFALKSVRLDEIRRSAGAKALTVGLEAARLIEGRIIAGDTHTPLGGVRLTVVTGSSYTHARHTTIGYERAKLHTMPLNEVDGRTDANGHFRLYPQPGSRMRVEVHAPAGSNYLAMGRELVWAPGVSRQELNLELLPGVMLQGRVVDADSGRPIRGAHLLYGSRPWDNPQYRADILQGRDRLLSVDDEGRFRVAVLPGPGRLLAYGPSDDYLAEPFTSQRIQNPKPEDRRFYAHAQAYFDLKPQEYAKPLELRLRRGNSISGRVVGTDDLPVASAVLLSAEHVSAMRNGAIKPLPVREGRFELPGCAPGRRYPVVILDPVGKQAGQFDLQALSPQVPDSTPRELRLKHCGEARVRLVTPLGEPIPRRALALCLELERSRLATVSPEPRYADEQASFWFDSVNYGGDLLTDSDGWITLPALVPGVGYRLVDAKSGKHLLRFSVTEGENKKLPDIVIEPPGQPDDFEGD